jgi:hypothetical protein
LEEKNKQIIDRTDRQKSKIGVGCAKVSFRNLIVHNNDKIYAEIGVGILKKSLSDFDAFKKAVAKLLETEE